jgi:hypothetical protein
MCCHSSWLLHCLRLGGLLLLLAGSGQVLAAAGMQYQLPLIQEFFPQADSVGELQGDPPAAPVYGGSRLLGYVYYTDDVAPIPAYSGKPIRALVGFDMNGRITGVQIVHHEEPILLAGVTEQQLRDFIDQYVGKSISDKIKIGGRDRNGYKAIDTISGATITVMVFNAMLNKSMRKVAAARGLLRQPGNAAGAAAGKEDAIWIHVWRERQWQIGVLGAGLLLLLLILILQDWLARHATLLTYLRTGFLIYTVVFIGWYALAQLSIVNVLTFISSFMRGFSWDNFLVDPLMFILWGFVAVAVLLWGRGVYCGWLCPFGAMQELIFRIGEKLRLPALEFPEVVHERLWAIKYIILLGLFALSLQSLSLAETWAEVEPFKTATVMHFQREWSYVLYAGGLLLIGVFNRKFYCRYLCPLGAALTFPARFRIFDWLRRRRECGRPCQICRQECEVRAIRSTGEINANECHYCLDCQVTYWNDHKCPPLVDKRKRRERHSRKAGDVAAPGRH